MFLKNRYLLFFSIMLILSIINYGEAQIKKDETVIFSGVIEKVDKNYKFIVVNERMILLSNTTKIVDDNGNILQKSNLKLNVLVTIEAIQDPIGFLANRITIKVPKR